MLNRIGIYVLVVIALVATASALWGWYNPKVEVQKEYVEVEVPREILKIQKVEVPIEKVVVIEKEKVIKEVKLPEAIKGDETKQITAVANVTPHEWKTSVVAVVDTKTGETSLMARKEPRPFLGFMNDKEIGIRYGLRVPEGTGIDVFARWSFLRVGPAYLAAYVEGNTGGVGKAMIEVSYRW